MDHSEEIRAIVKESWKLRRAKQLKEAELKLYEALEKYPENPFLEANLADIYLRQGRLSDARDTSFQALEKNSRQAMALTVLGEIALQEKNAAEAVENLKQAYAITPHPYRGGRLARAYELAGDKGKALAVLQHALEDNPGDTYLRRQYNRLQKELAADGSQEQPATGAPTPGRSHSAPAISTGETSAAPAGQGRSPGKEAAGEEEDDTSPAYAEKLREQLSSLEPGRAAAQLEKISRIGRRMENPHLQTLLGDFFRLAGNDEKAAQAYKKARELDPEQQFAASQEAFCYRRLGNNEAAWPLLKRVLEKTPGDKPALSSLIKDAGELGRLQEAIDFLAELVNQHPQHKELYGYIKKLEKKKQPREED